MLNIKLELIDARIKDLKERLEYSSGEFKKETEEELRLLKTFRIALFPF